MKKLILPLLFLFSSTSVADTPPQKINVVCPAHQWLDEIVPGMAPVCTQPLYSDIGGSIPAVSSLNSETGAVNLVAGSNITITPSGQNITISAAGGSTIAWGSITGTLSNQTDLQSALNAKQSTLSFSAPLVNTSGTVSLSNTAVTPGSYTNSNIQVDAQGRIISASNGSPGGVTSVTGTSPIVSSGGSTPAISLGSTGTAGTYTKITTDAHGLVSSGTTLSASDIPSLLSTKISDFQTSVSANTDVSANTAARHNAVTLGTANGLSLSTQVLSLQAADATHTGALTSANWSTFNSKQSAFTPGNISTSTTGVSVSGGSNSTVGPNTTINIQNANTSQNGLLTSSDWNSFSSKQPPGAYITAITGDLSASGPNSAVGTLATVNSNVGSFTAANITVDGKGRILSASNGSSGGSPGGSATQIQYKVDSTHFGGAPLSSVDSGNAFIGIQESTPYAPLHVNGAQGTTPATPANFTSSLTQIFPVDEPTTYTTTEIDSPVAPALNTPTFTYIDPAAYPATAFNATGGYTANCQTISYFTNTYVNLPSGGGRLVNPTQGSATYTDTICDGTTTFSVDLSNVIINSAARGDGILITKYDNMGYGPYVTDVGLPSGGNYNDNFSIQNNDTYLTSAYTTSSINWNTYLAKSINVGGTDYTGVYASNSAMDDDSGAYFYLTSSWTNVGGETYWTKNANSGTYYFNLANANIFYDYGQSGVSAPAVFSSISFPYFDTSLTGASATTAPSFSSGCSFVADGSTWTVNTWSFKINPVDNQKYFVSSPDGSSGTADANDSQNYCWNGTYTPGSGSGDLLILLKNGTPVASVIGSSGSYSFSTPNTPDPTTPSISSYTGITRNYLSYGKKATPQYSSSGKLSVFSDTNPVDGYLIQHNVSGFGNATSEKIIDSTFTQHVTPDPSSDPTSFYETLNSHDSDVVVTPSNNGFLATGQVADYVLWADVASIYSATPATHSQIFPNNSNYYTVDLSWSSVASATYKIQKVGTGYSTSSPTSFSDDTTQPWSASSTTTPTRADTTAIIAEKPTSSFSDETSVLTIRTANSGSSQINGLQLQYGGAGASGATIYKMGINSIGNFQQNSSTGIYEFADSGSQKIAKVGFNTLFNMPSSAAASVGMLGSSAQYLFYSDSSLNSVFFGNVSTYGSYDPNAAVAIVPQGSDRGLEISVNPGVDPNTTLALDVQDQFNSHAFSITNNGHIRTGYFNYIGAEINAGSGSAGTDEITFEGLGSMGGFTSHAGSLNYFSATTPFTNSSTAASGQLLWTDKLANIHEIITAADPATSGEYWRSDSNGKQVVDNTLIKSGTILKANVLLEGVAGISVDQNQTLTMGNNAQLVGTFRTDFNPHTTSATLNQANDSPWARFTGSTASQTLTLPTASSLNGIWYGLVNDASVTVTLATTSSQTLNFDGTTVTTLVLNPGDRILNISDGSNWRSLVWRKTVPVANGGTGLASGTSGGIPYFSSSSAISSSAALTANQLILGGGAGTTPASLGSLGTTTTVLHGNASGAPSFGSIALAADVSGTLPFGNGGTGQTTQQAAINALTGTQSSGKYLRSDGTNSTLATIQAADVPTLNQNTTGTAANVTASSNSTLTTLSALSLPGSQVTGNISGNAANITASSNSTLTTLSSLSLPGSQVTGNISGNAANVTGTVANNHGGTGGDSSGSTGLAHVSSGTWSYSSASLTSDVSGILPIANGGTASATASAAITSLTGTQVSGQYLRSNGTIAAMSAIQAADVPTLNQNTTGTAANITASSNSTLTTLSALSLPGSQVTGNISGNSANITGIAAIANGGSGQSTQQAAINALTGTQSSGKYLRSDGTNSTLATIQAADVPTLNQNTTGTALNITASSNSTLTTLSSLSLPGSQVTGNISGNAANVTASSNSTLTTLSALSLPGSQVVFTKPKVTTYTTGSGTFTITGSPLYIRVRMLGAGGGGAGSGTGGSSSNNGGNGGGSTFGTSLLVANGGNGGAYNGSGGTGGTASLGSGPTGTAVQGASGSNTNNLGQSFQGASAAWLGGGGAAGQGANGSSGAGGNAIANTGSGGGGAGTGTLTPGASGGAGGFVEAFISGSTLSGLGGSAPYSIGTGGASGTAATTGGAGGSGAYGYIEATEYYQ